MSIRLLAVEFLKSLSDEQRARLKTMVENGVQVGIDYANRNGITSEQLTNELKAIYKE